MASALAGDDLARSMSSQQSWASTSLQEASNALPEVFAQRMRRSSGGGPLSGCRRMTASGKAC